MLKNKTLIRLFTIVLFIQFSFSLIGQRSPIALDLSYGKSYFIDTDERANFFKTSNYSLKLSTYRVLSSKIDAQVGIIYRSFKDQHVDKHNVLFGCDIPISLGGMGLESSIVSNFTSKYIGVPIAFRFRITDKPSFLYAKVGSELLINIANKVDSKILECGINEINHNFAEDKDAYTSTLIVPNAAIGCFFDRDKVKYYLELSAGLSIHNIFEQLNSSILPNVSVESTTVRFIELRGGFDF